MPFTQEMIGEVIQRTEQLLQTRSVVDALQSCWDKTSVLKQVSAITTSLFASLFIRSAS